MGDAKTILDVFDPKQREFLRRCARDHGSTVQDELKRLVAAAMDGSRPKDSLDNLVGMCHGDGTVTGENFHDYLYGRSEGQ